jgi:hypothetical protein
VSRERAEQLFGALLNGDTVKAADLSPWTKAVLDVPELTADDEALLEQQAVRLAPLPAPFPPPISAASAPEPELEPAPAEDPPHDDTEDPEEEAPSPAPVEEPGSTPHVAHDDIPTEELHVEPKGLPEQPADEAFRRDFGFMFNSQEVVPDAYRIVLALKYKENWLDWEPETLWAAIRSDFGPVGDVARGKIMALRTSLKTNTPWIDWDAFEHVSQAFNDGLVLFGLMQPPELEEAAYTVTVMRRLGDWPFGSDVSGYLAAVCLNAGLVFAPEDWFPSAQYFMDRQSKAAPALRDTVAAAWEKLRDVNLSAVTWRENNPVDNQVKKLWSVKSYLDSRLLQPAEPEGDTLSAGGAS